MRKHLDSFSARQAQICADILRPKHLLQRIEVELLVIYHQSQS